MITLAMYIVSTIIVLVTGLYAITAIGYILYHLRWILIPLIIYALICNPRLVGL